MIDTKELIKAGQIEAANEIDKLRDFAMWMTGCGYDFCQHEYFCKQRDKLLKQAAKNVDDLTPVDDLRAMGMV